VTATAPAAFSSDASTPLFSNEPVDDSEGFAGELDVDLLA
jgi:hypothetical protein